MSTGGKKFWRAVFLFIIFTSGYGFTQTQTSTSENDNKETKSPTGAVIRSAIIPGLGQVYNGKYFKAILVLGGELALVGNAVYYQQYQIQSTSADEREFYRNIKSRFLWWLFAFHLLNVIDAYVDASLSGFDTGPDLSRSVGRSDFYTLVSLNIKF